MLLFFDIDGTLAIPGQKPGNQVVQAIQLARLNGHKVFLCTGRPRGDIPDDISKIGFDGGIYSAGGHVIAGTTVLADHPMPKKLVQDVCKILDAEYLPYVLECENRIYQRKGSLDIARQSSESGNSSELNRFLCRLQSDTMDGYQGEAVYKISFIAQGPEQVNRISQQIGDTAKVVCFENMISDLMCIAGEISNKHVNKGLALKEMCAYYGADLSQSVAFGDSMNDAEMLSAAGIGIAMADAPDDVKALADQICERCSEDGVAKAMLRLGLIGKLPVKEEFITNCPANEQ